MVAATAAVALVTAGCSGSSASDSSNGAVTITFWHSMGGTNGEALQHLVHEFNQENKGKIKVVATYEGNYDDTLAKLKASIQSQQTPDVAQIYDIGTRFMYDSHIEVPVQDFIDNDPSFDKGVLEKNILSYYSIGDKLYSMPFNTSMPVLYYNKDAFKAAGLDPNKPPTTLEEIRADSEKLTKPDHSQYGFGSAIYGWFLEQYTAKVGKTYCDQGNGRDGLATKVLFDQPADVQFVDWWQQMVKDGLAANPGRNTDNAQAAFKAGKVAINLESTGTMGAYQEGAKFDVGVGYFPGSAGASQQGGTVIGGASLWVLKHDDQAQQASWQFLKFLAAPESQAYWHTHTGYFPMNSKALDEPSDKAWLKKYPGFQVAIDQLHQTPTNVYTSGCLLGVMPQARQAAEVGWENAVLQKASPQQAMTAAAKSLEPAIKQYNQSIQQQ